MNEYVDVNYAYRELERLDIWVESCQFEEHIALSTPQGVMGIDLRRVHTQAEELEVLLHEIGHFETCAFYTMQTPPLVVDKMENAANRHVFETYYPAEKLAACMKKGITEPWELAETLSLPEAYVRELLHYYTQVQGINFNELALQISGAEHGDEEPAPPPEEQPQALEPNWQEEAAHPALRQIRADLGRLCAQWETMREDWQEEQARYKDHIRLQSYANSSC